MPTIQLQAQLSARQLIEAVEQLSADELEQFASQVATLQARRRARALSPDETQLLIQINRGLPPDLRTRYEELIVRRSAAVLTPDEHRELIDLGNRVEQLEAERAGHLADLARLRNVSLPRLLDDLGIQAARHG